MIRTSQAAHRRPYRHSADPEALLWRALGEALPRARFLRNVQIGPYVAAFASRAGKLIVEVDDGRPGSARDSARTRFLNRHGYRLIRFWDDDVVHDTGAIIDALACALPPELLADSNAQCRISGPATRAEWSPRPDFPARKPAPAAPRHDPLSAGVK